MDSAWDAFDHLSFSPTNACWASRRMIITSWNRRSRAATTRKALVRAHWWRRRIESGRAKSITDLAEHEGVTDAYVCRLLPLTCLAPDIVEAILDGRQPKGLRLAEMLGNVAVDWHGQRAVVERGISQEGAR